jgi:two-component system sensor histidine kinase KdpD
MDLALMTQVLVNIIDNSLKYAPDAGSIELTAGTVGGNLLLEIEDHGPGVPEADLSRVFDKFYRVPVPEGAGGTGLGLSISKGIVDAHGGSIRAKNRAGGGLSVTVTLPL